MTAMMDLQAFFRPTKSKSKSARAIGLPFRNETPCDRDASVLNREVSDAQVTPRKAGNIAVAQLLEVPCELDSKIALELLDQPHPPPTPSTTRRPNRRHERGLTRPL